MGKLIKELQDLTYLNWSKCRNSSGTAGSFLKAQSNIDGKLYYKLSNYNTVDGIIGHECVNELIIDRLLTILGIEHLEYNLKHAKISINGEEHITWLCESRDFKEPFEEKVAFDQYYNSEKSEKETELEFCIRNGWSKYIYQMLVVDFLVLNRDRHGANLEVLRNKRKRTYRLSPLFDHGISLLSRCEEADISQYNVLEEKPVQCCVGGRIAKDNLKLIPKEHLPILNPLRESHKTILIGDLDGVLSVERLEKIWEMIWKRWCYYEDLCN